MAIDSESNNGIYFTLGALIVAIAVLGFLFMGNDNTISSLEPSAGYEAPSTTINNNTDTTPDSTSREFDLRVDDDGVSGSTSRQSQPD